jgi:hypothetical protein
VQGKKGSIELKDLAQEMASVAPSFAQFAGGTGVEGMTEMGAALQFIRQGFGGSAEAATGFRALMVSLNRNADKFQKAGVQMFDKDPATGELRLRKFRDLVMEIGDSPLARDPTKLTKAFGSDEAKRAFDQLWANRDALAGLVEESQNAKAVQQDLDRYMQSDAGKVKKAWEEAKNALAEAFTPERIQAFVAALVKAAEALGWVVDKADAVISTAEKAGRGAAILVGGLSQEDQLIAKENDKRDSRAAFIRFMRNVSQDEALTQVAHEDEAKRRIRAGMYDDEHSSVLQVRRARIDEGVYSNREDLLNLLDGRIARAQQREAAGELKNAVRDGMREAGALQAVTVGGDTIVKAARMAGNVFRTRPEQ